MFNSINKLLENSLQLEEPWEITHTEFNEKEGAAHITVDVRKGAQFVCPECGGETKRYTNCFAHMEEGQRWGATRALYEICGKRCDCIAFFLP